MRAQIDMNICFNEKHKKSQFCLTLVKRSIANFCVISEKVC